MKTTHTQTCGTCNRPEFWFDCKYPMWIHEGATPRHGDWVPDHNCEADWSRRTSSDTAIDCN